MALKQCSLCDRKFTKLEHVKRHERSHTRERPYECPTCKKHFSRSDVLFRHCKGHAQNALNRLSNSNQSSQLHHKTSNGSEEQSMNPPPVPQPNASQPGDHNSDDQILSPLSRRMSTRDHVPPMNGDPSQNRLPSPSITVRPAMSQHASPNDSRLEALINAAQQLDPPGEIAWRSPSPINISAEGDRCYLPRAQDSIAPPIDPAIDMLSFSPAAHVSSLDQWAFELVQSNHPLPNRTPADALQTWLFPLDNDLLSQSTSNMTYNHNNFDEGYRSGILNPDGHSSPSGSSASIASRIPRERFARVENCWPSRTRKPTRLMPTLWRDIIASDSTNLFCEPLNGQTLTPMSERERRNSRWGFDDECRDLLQGALNSTPPAPTMMRTYDSYGDTASSSGDAGQSPGGEGVIFPPAEILDIALEMYLYHFHPTLPIVHIPTFSAKTASRPMLLVMCLLGLSILGTAGASKFVSRTFPTVLQIVSNELQTVSSSRHPPEKQIRILATALLTLNLAGITGRRSRIAQSEKLYMDLLSAAQNHGLFSCNEGQLPDDFIDSIMDLDTKWKAWSRVECVKRLILGLLEADCWYAAYFSISPTTRPETVQILPPAEHTLFHAHSATKWLQLTQRGVRLHTTRITPAFLPPPGMKLESSSLRTLLTMHLLRIYESNDRLINCDRGVSKYLEPWRVYAEDPRSRDLIPLLVSLSSSGVDVLRSADLNSSVLWHASCMMLGANFRIFELAAGRSGPSPAVSALDDIAAWAQTASARRSILHAAHIFKLLFDRKVSDVVTSHSVVALFQAALVLGLYVFTLPQSCPANPESCIELLELIDWTCVGHVGLIETPASPGSQLGYSSEGPVINFIRNGGPFSITGIALEGGYLAARRTLLHCADLMDGMGRWKSRTFSQILHIMSDDLTDIDMVDSDEQ